MKKVDKKRRQVREELRQKMLDWYLRASGYDPSNPLEDERTADFCQKLQFCVDEKAYRDTVLYWIDPPIIGMNNPIAIETDVQGVWSCVLEVRKIDIKSYGGL